MEWEASVATIRKLWDAFNRGDFESALEGLHPEIAIRDLPGFPGGRWYHGYEGAGEWAANLLSSFSDITVEPEDFVPVDDERLVVTVTVRALGKRSGTRVEQPMAGLVTMREGKCQRLAVYDSLREALAAAAD